MSTAGTMTSARGARADDAARLGRTILIAVSLAHLFNDAVQSIIPAMLPILREKYGFSFLELGFITLTIQLTSSVLQPFIGGYFDRSAKRAPIVLTMLFSLCGLLLLGAARSLPIILCAVALIGCGSAFFHPESSRIAQAVSRGRKGLAQAVFQVGGNAGSTLGPLIAAWIIIPMGQGGICSVALAALPAIATLMAIQKLFARYAQAAGTLSRKAASCAAAVRPVTRTVKRAMALLLVLMVSKQVYVSSLSSYLTFFVMDKFGLSTAAAQYVLFGFLAAGAAGTLVGGPLTDRFGKRSVIFGSIVGAAPFALALPWTGLAGTIACSMAASFIIASAFSSILVAALNLFPSKTGAVSGLFLGLSFGIGGLTTVLMGLAIDTCGIFRVFAVISAVPLLGLAALLLPKKELEGE